MIDLRLSKQYYKGFYIYKYLGHWSVGKNGTSVHKNFKRVYGDQTIKSRIITFIENNPLEVLNNDSNK
jgi:hypothetical protein